MGGQQSTGAWSFVTHDKPEWVLPRILQRSSLTAWEDQNTKRVDRQKVRLDFM